MENMADNCHVFFCKINNTARLLNLHYSLLLALAIMTSRKSAHFI